MLTLRAYINKSSFFRNKRRASRERIIVMKRRTIIIKYRFRAKVSKIVAGSRICVERPGNESLDRYVGIGRWKLSTDIAGSSNRRGRSTNSTCHGKWIGDSRLLVDCHDPRCEQPSQVPPYTSQLFRDRRDADADADADVVVVGNPDRSARRRRRGRRRKRSRRRRRDAVAER